MFRVVTTLFLKEIEHLLPQPGEQRNKEETHRVVIDQLHTAATGVAKHVADSQASTGVKDRLAQHSVERLIKQYHKLKKRTDKPMSKADVTAHLRKWVDTHEKTIISSTLTTDGTCCKIDMITKH